MISSMVERKGMSRSMVEGKGMSRSMVERKENPPVTGRWHSPRMVQDGQLYPGAQLVCMHTALHADCLTAIPVTFEVSHPVCLCGRFFKAPEAAAAGGEEDEITPAGLQPGLLSRLAGCRELQFSEQRGEEDGREQQVPEERGCLVSKNLAELFGDRQEEEGSKARKWTTAGVYATDKEREDREAVSRAESYPVLQHPMCPESRSVSSEGVLEPSSPSTGPASMQPTAIPASCGPPAKRVRKSLQSFLFAPQTSDPSQQTGVLMKINSNTEEGNGFMQQEDFITSGIGYLRRATSGENGRVPSPPPSLSTQEEQHSCVSTSLPETQSSTIDLTAETPPAAITPTVRKCGGQWWRAVISYRASATLCCRCSGE